MARSPKSSEGHKGGRGIVLDIDEHIIRLAVERSSSHCVIADALRMAVPAAERVSVDLQTIRFTDPKTERRYVFLTPPAAQVVLVKFDQGIMPEPFLLKLGKPAQIVRKGASHPDKSKPRKRTAGRAIVPPAKREIRATTSHDTPTVFGGRTPPTAALSSTTGRRRTFGLKSLKP
jgi:hypothetical protein